MGSGPTARGPIRQEERSREDLLEYALLVALLVMIAIGAITTGGPRERTAPAGFSGSLTSQ